MKRERSGTKVEQNFVGGLFTRMWQQWRRPLTIMLAPHDEGRVISFRVSILSLWIFGLLFVSLLFVVIIFSTSSYHMDRQLAVLKGSIRDMAADSDTLRNTIQHLPALTDILEDTVNSISSNTNIDFSHPQSTFWVNGDLTNSSVSSKNFHSNEGNEVAQLERSLAVIEDLIPMVTKISDLLDTQKQFLSEIPTAWPVSSNRGFITMLFGPGRDPFTDGWQFHTGVDIAYSLGTPVLVAADGVVVRTSYNPGGYGNVVLVRHGYGFYTRYAHMQRYVVREGDRVHQGQQLGLMGATGRATGSHVHFEVLLGTEVVDPMRYLSIINPSLIRYIRDRS